MGVFDEKRTRAKSSDFLYVLIQAVRTERTRGLKIRRRVPHCENTDLPQQRWQAANCNAFVGWCLFRRWQIACKKDRNCEEYCLRKTFESWNQAFCRYLAAAGEWMHVRLRCFMLFYSPLLGFDLTERSRSLVNANPIFTILNLYSF